MDKLNKSLKKAQLNNNDKLAESIKAKQKLLNDKILK